MQRMKGRAASVAIGMNTGADGEPADWPRTFQGQQRRPKGGPPSSWPGYPYSWGAPLRTVPIFPGRLLHTEPHAATWMPP
ncbi:hypothetical protein LEMLEM_LOCUS23080, partial [Lemmus lemmus]